MLVEFNVANFLSIKEKQTLSLQAAAIVSKDKVDEKNVFDAPGGLRLLKSAAIYGANASGKSNLVKAMVRMLTFVDRSFQDEEDIGKFYPFALDVEYHEKPMHFEIVFVLGGKQYRYGFEVTRQEVIAEWLFGPASKSEVAYFTREYDKITVNQARFKEGSDLQGKTRRSTLFLNIVHAFNGPIATEIKHFLRRSVIVTTGLNDRQIRDATTRMLEDPALKDRIVALLKSADFGIQEINNVDAALLRIPDGPIVPDEKKEGVITSSKVLTTVRKIKNEREGELPTAFVFENFESEGTKKFYTYAGPIVDSLTNGATLVMDEFDARWHPSLTRQIVELFNSREFNPNNAQLVFVTHDSNLLDPLLLRRDQIYFVEKNEAGETSLYSLINVGGVRNDASYEKDYLKGKYGALPFLGQLKSSAK